MRAVAQAKHHGWRGRGHQGVPPALLVDVALDHDDAVVGRRLPSGALAVAITSDERQRRAAAPLGAQVLAEAARRRARVDEAIFFKVERGVERRELQGRAADEGALAQRLPGVRPGAGRLERTALDLAERRARTAERVLVFCVFGRARRALP